MEDQKRKLRKMDYTRCSSYWVFRSFAHIAQEARA